MAAPKGTVFRSLKIRGDTLDDLEALLKRLPAEVREKSLKKAIRDGTKEFQKVVKGNAQTMLGRTKRWGTKGQPKLDLKKQIRRGTRRTTDASGVRGWVAAADELRSYGGPVEFGHRMFIPRKQAGGGYKAEEMTGRKVPQYPWWRPAERSTKPVIHNLIIQALRKQLKNFHA